MGRAEDTCGLRENLAIERDDLQERTLHKSPVNRKIIKREEHEVGVGKFATVPPRLAPSVAVCCALRLQQLVPFH